MAFGVFGGMKVISSPHAFEMVPIFPDKPKTKRRLRRTRGKYGRTDRANPLCYRTGTNMIIAHPSLVHKLRAHASEWSE